MTDEIVLREHMTDFAERLTLTIAETAKLLGVSLPTAYLLAKRGEIPVLKLGKRLVVPRRALDDFLASAKARNAQNDQKGKPHSPTQLPEFFRSACWHEQASSIRRESRPQPGTLRVHSTIPSVHHLSELRLSKRREMGLLNQDNRLNSLNLRARVTRA